jgi:hypothetical protein
MRHSPLWIVVLVVSPALAEINPVTPTEEEIFKTGEPCLIEWDADTQPGGWKTMRIGKFVFVMHEHKLTRIL